MTKYFIATIVGSTAIFGLFVAGVLSFELTLITVAGFGAFVIYKTITTDF